MSTKELGAVLRSLGVFEFIIEDDHLENQEAPQRYDELDINANFFLNAGSMI